MALRGLLLGAVLLCAYLLLPTVGQEIKKRKEVAIGYMLNYNPWKLAVNLGTFERVTGYTVKWLEVQDSYKATIAMANNEVQLVVANSADIARAFSREMPARMVYVIEEVKDSEALVVQNKHHASWGGPIRSPKDLVGRDIYVWYGSTAHYSLESVLNEMNIPIVRDTEYMRGADCRYIPCQYEQNSNAVTLIGRTQPEILSLWKSGEAIAVYLGLPELNEIVKNGTVLFTNSMVAKWGGTTFNGLLASNRFLDRLDPKYASYNVRTFMEQVIQELAKANFYYVNNSKEFQMRYVLDTIGTSRVAGGIASVTGGTDENEVARQLVLRKYPSMPEMVTCLYMGCGNRSRVAWALRDMSMFLKSIKEDFNTKGGLNTALTQRDVKTHLKSTSDIRFVALAEVRDAYEPYIDASYVEGVLAQGLDGTYDLPTGVYVHLGYEVMAMFGPTRSFLIA